VLARNVRFLLWREGLPPSRWVERLRERLGRTCTEEETRSLLMGRTPSYLEIRQLAEAFGLPEEELAHSDFVAGGGTDILLENLRYLLGNLERGGKQALVESLGLDPSTVSRWLKGTRPQSSTLHDLRAYFGLSPTTDLKTDPLFLSLEPVSSFERRRWLQERIGEMSSEELRELFPALQRLFRKPRK
jgi:transcriptional regulator with XRE-family HTH domain